MHSSIKTSAVAAAAVLAFGAGPASAALVTYFASDNNASSLAQMTNSVAQQGLFLGAVAGTSLIDFESGLPAGVTTGNGTITSNSGCGALCGFNTTPGGSNFLLRTNASVSTITMNFANAVDAFGMYVTGLQNFGPQSITVTYDTLQTVNLATPVVTDGAGFFGLVDAGANIISVTFNRGTDIVALDDVLYRASNVPEPSSWAITLAALAGLGVSSRRKQTAAT